MDEEDFVPGGGSGSGGSGLIDVDNDGNGIPDWIDDLMEDLEDDDSGSGKTDDDILDGVNAGSNFDYSDNGGDNTIIVDTNTYNYNIYPNASEFAVDGPGFPTVWINPYPMENDRANYNGGDGDDTIIFDPGTWGGNLGNVGTTYGTGGTFGAYQGTWEDFIDAQMGALDPVNPWELWHLIDNTSAGDRYDAWHALIQSNHMVFAPGFVGNVNGGAGNDLIVIGSGNFVLTTGGEGNDVLINAHDGVGDFIDEFGATQGGPFQPGIYVSLHGGFGDDLIISNSSTSWITGGEGDDTVIASNMGSNSPYVLNVPGLADAGDPEGYNWVIHSELGEGDDLFIGSTNFVAGEADDDTLILEGLFGTASGGEGNDTLSTTWGNLESYESTFGELDETGVTLQGDEGDDTLTTGDGHFSVNTTVSLYGGADNDTLVIEETGDGDTSGTFGLYGGTGDDDFLVEEGVQIDGDVHLDGGNGDDTFVINSVDTSMTLTGSDSENADDYTDIADLSNIDPAMIDKVEWASGDAVGYIYLTNGEVIELVNIDELLLPPGVEVPTGGGDDQTGSDDVVIDSMENVTVDYDPETDGSSSGKAEDDGAGNAGGEGVGGTVDWGLLELLMNGSQLSEDMPKGEDEDHTNAFDYVIGF